MSQYRSNRPYRSRGRQRQRGPSHPMLMGEPSPALSKIARMNIVKLNEYIATNKTQIERLAQKVKNLQEVEPVNNDRVETLEKQQERLHALIAAAEKQLSVKNERKERYEARQ